MQLAITAERVLAATAIDSKGNMLQLGGLSECTGDMGNGNWIAQTAFRLIYDEVYLGLEPTLITKMYYDAFGITSREEFVGTVAKLETGGGSALYQDSYRLVLQGGGYGRCPLALAKTDEMAKRGAQFIAALAKADGV